MYYSLTNKFWNYVTYFLWPLVEVHSHHTSATATTWYYSLHNSHLLPRITQTPTPPSHCSFIVCAHHIIHVYYIIHPPTMRKIKQISILLHLNTKTTTHHLSPYLSSLPHLSNFTLPSWNTSPTQTLPQNNIQKVWISLL